jgi:hypothetical protein
MTFFSYHLLAFVFTPLQVAVAYRFHWRGLIICSVAALALICLGLGFLLYVRHFYTPESVAFAREGYKAAVLTALTAFGTLITFVIVGTTPQ